MYDIHRYFHYHRIPVVKGWSRPQITSRSRFAAIKSECASPRAEGAAAAARAGAGPGAAEAEGGADVS